MGFYKNTKSGIDVQLQEEDKILRELHPFCDSRYRPENHSEIKQLGLGAYKTEEGLFLSSLYIIPQVSDITVIHKMCKRLCLGGGSYGSVRRFGYTELLFYNQNDRSVIRDYINKYWDRIDFEENF